MGLTYDLMYLGLKAELCNLAGEEFYCTGDEMAAEGKDPDDYFREVKATRFIVQWFVWIYGKFTTSPNKYQ